LPWRILNRKTRKPNKDQEILDVASEYFLAHGYSGTSISEMAREAGISKESIYRYFENKEALFSAVIDKEMTSYQASLKTTNPDLTDLRQTLLDVADTISGTLNSDRVLSLRRLIFHLATVSSDVGLHYYEVGPQQAYRMLTELFKLHENETEFEPERLMQYFAAMVSHRLILERECRVRRLLTKTQLQKLMERTVDDFLKAFFPGVTPTK
jgi:AcrR family transcriptional regulator